MANGILYVAAKNRLFAIQKGAEIEVAAESEEDAAETDATE